MTKRTTQSYPKFIYKNTYNFQVWNEVINCAGMAYPGPSLCALKVQMSCYNNKFDASEVIRHLRSPSAPRDFDNVQDISWVIQIQGSSCFFLNSHHQNTIQVPNFYSSMRGSSSIRTIMEL